MRGFRVLGFLRCFFLVIQRRRQLLGAFDLGVGSGRIELVDFALYGLLLRIGQSFELDALFQRIDNFLIGLSQFFRGFGFLFIDPVELQLLQLVSQRQFFFDITLITAVIQQLRLNPLLEGGGLLDDFIFFGLRFLFDLFIDLLLDMQQFLAMLTRFLLFTFLPCRLLIGFVLGDFLFELGLACL